MEGVNTSISNPANNHDRAELNPVVDTKVAHKSSSKFDNLDSAVVLEKRPSVAATAPSIDFGGKTTWIAWVFTVCISLHNAACTIMWQTASSAAITTADWMNANLTQVNWLSNTSAIANCIFSIVCVWSYERFGIKACLIFSAVMNVLGCWIRCLSIVADPAHRYPVVLLGQIIASIGGPFVYNISAKFVALWFAPADRGLGNMLTALSIGQIVIPVAGPLLARVPEETPRSFIIVAVISTVAAVPLLMMPNKPKEAPSASACASRTSVWDGMRTLVRNAQFWTIAIITSFNAGMFFSISVTVVQAAAPYGYTESQTGLAGSLSAIAGYLGGAMTGYWAGRSFQHLMILKMFTPMLCTTYIMLIFEIVPNAYGVLVIAIMLIGFFAMGLLPIQLEYACELMYPIPESLVSNLIWASISISMLIFTVISDTLRAGPDANPPGNMHNSLIASAVLMCVGSLPCLWLNGDMKRLKVDKSEQVSSEA